MKARLIICERVYKKEQENRANRDEKQITVPMAKAVVQLNRILMQKLIDKNRNQFDVYIDEKFLSTEWHTKALPHGFFLKIVEEDYPITDTNVADDMLFWDREVMNIERVFADNQLVRWIFSENRCMSAEVYAVQRKQIAAEQAFYQAIRIAPDFWKPYFGICNQVYLPQKKNREAIALLENYIRLTGVHADARIEQLLAKIRLNKN